MFFFFCKLLNVIAGEIVDSFYGICDRAEREFLEKDLLNEFAEDFQISSERYIRGSLLKF